MVRIRFSLIAILAFIFLSCSGNKKDDGLTEKDVSYSGGGKDMKGYLVYSSKTQDKRPGVIVVPEWWGLNDYPKMRARELANLGYAALAVDMYGNGEIANTPDTAGKLAASVFQDPASARARFAAAYDLLRQQSVVDTSKIAAIGYCFGGGVVLMMARTGFPLDGVVSFHGSLMTQPPPLAGQVKAKFLICNGADDPFNPPQTVEAFRKQMDSAGVDYRLINYPGAKHAFTNPAADSLGRLFNMPIAYNASADHESWKSMQDFLAQVFAK